MTKALHFSCLASCLVLDTDTGGRRFIGKEEFPIFCVVQARTDATFGEDGGAGCRRPSLLKL